jgi:hypothetical protein
MIALERGAISVICVAVSFDDYSLLYPNEIDEPPFDQNIDRRQRQSGLPAQSQKIDLKWRASLDSPWIRSRNDPAEPSDPETAVASLQQLDQARPSQSAGSIRGNDCALQLPRVEKGSDIDQGPLDRCHSNCDLHHHVFPRQNCLMKLDAGALAPA